jgi:hypothetical protein
MLQSRAGTTPTRTVAHFTPGLSARALIAGLQLGIAGDVLLRGGGLGLNALILVTATALCGVHLASQREGMSRESVLLLGLAVFFSAALAWRDAELLTLVNVAVIGLALSLPLLGSGVKRLSSSGIGQYARAGLLAAEQATIGVFRLAAAIEWQAVIAPERAGTRRLLAVGRGVVIALPLVVLFGALFVAADAVFARLVTTTLRFDVQSAIGHVVLTMILTWGVAGWFHGIMAGNPASEEGHAEEPSGYLGATEVCVVLALLNALFLAFVLVQVRYLFGGTTMVAVTPGLTYAEYARRGFFELVTVSTLVLPLLLGAEWVRTRRTIGAEWVFRSLAGILVVLLLVIMGSAVYRMRLYTAEFGLTADRFYATAFMCWLAVVFSWFTLTVLRGRRQRFAFGAFASAILAAGTLNVLAPDAIVARVNLERLAEGKRFDGAHLGTLSADAVPVIAGAVSRMAPLERCQVARRLLDRWGPQKATDWRAFNQSRWRAKAAVDRRLTELQAAALTTPAVIPAPGGPTPARRSCAQELEGPIASEPAGAAPALTPSITSPTVTTSESKR